MSSGLEVKELSKIIQHTQLQDCRFEHMSSKTLLLNYYATGEATRVPKTSFNVETGFNSASPSRFFPLYVTMSCVFMFPNDSYPILIIGFECIHVECSYFVLFFSADILFSQLEIVYSNFNDNK